MRYLDLSNNKLGTKDAAGTAASRAEWCPNEGVLSAGSGWCPAQTPYIAGTAASLVSLDLSNNGFAGENLRVHSGRPWWRAGQW